MRETLHAVVGVGRTKAQGHEDEGDQDDRRPDIEGS